MAITEFERFGHSQRLGIPTQVVEFEPEPVARNALSDRNRELDEEVVESFSAHRPRSERVAPPHY